MFGKIWFSVMWKEKLEYKRSLWFSVNSLSIFISTVYEFYFCCVSSLFGMICFHVEICCMILPQEPWMCHTYIKGQGSPFSSVWTRGVWPFCLMMWRNLQGSLVSYRSTTSGSRHHPDLHVFATTNMTGSPNNFFTSPYENLVLLVAALQRTRDTLLVHLLGQK